jgi:uncharacterized membrane protein YkoI
MLKKRLLIGTGIAAVATAGFLLGNLALGPVFAQPQPATSPTPAQCAMQSADDDAAEAAVEGPDVDAVEEEVGDQGAGVDSQAQEPSYTGSILVDEAQFDGLSETDEAAALQPMAVISSDDAKAVAEAANPGSTALQVGLDNENGVLVYSVELDNGLEVKVDAGNGTILHTEQADADEGTTGVEDALEQ